MTESAKKTLLLVDDSPCIRHVCGLELEREGYQVVPACHGKDALAKIGAQEFDLIILDMQMRPVSGFEVLARVRAERPELPIIAHTTFSEREVARRSVQMPDAHVLKGSDFGLMKAVVARLLSAAQAEGQSGQARMAS
ncbi:MAG TPA: response regulator [Pirellulales bacterium]|nr:response regulator [Pirellulales bacterium]